MRVTIFLREPLPATASNIIRVDAYAIDANPRSLWVYTSDDFNTYESYLHADMLHYHVNPHVEVPEAVTP